MHSKVFNNYEWRKKMQTFEVELRGDTPLMHHRMTEEALFGLLGTKSKKKKVKDDKTPRQIAEEHAYVQKDGAYCIPMSYISGAFIHVASDYKQKDSARKSYKSIAGGIFRPQGEFATLVNNKKPIKDFEVDVRKATNHKAGAVAVCRPRFDEWGLTFKASIDEDLIDDATALQILQDAGKRSGIGSFRVSKSGYFGQFSVVKWKRIKSK